MTCKLIKRLMKIEGVADLPYESIEQIKRIICGTHNGVCSEKYSKIKSNGEVIIELHDPNEKFKDNYKENIIK